MKTPVQSSDLNDLISARGAGGENHQNAKDGANESTAAKGVVIADNLILLQACTPWPTLLEVFAVREKTFHFDRERNLERVVPARGDGAHGTFPCTHALDERISGALSALVDAAAILRCADSLNLTPATRSFVTDAFQHCKYIGGTKSSKFSPDARDLIREVKDPANHDTAMCVMTDTASAEAVVVAVKTLRQSLREAHF